MFENKTINEWSILKTKTVLKYLKSSLSGLSDKEFEIRLKKYGKNVLVEERKNHWFFDLLIHFNNPLVLILVGAAIISAVFGEQINAVIILIIILFSTLLNFIQERKAGDAARKLKEGLKTTATLIRNNKKKEVKIENIVPGDIIFLCAGDLVPADSLVLESKDFFVNQSALTGESFPVEKTYLTSRTLNKSIAELDNIVFSGTNVETGTAKVIALKTDSHTEIGKIAQTLKKPEQQTSFTLGINQFSNLIMRTTLIVVFLVFFINIVLKREVFDSFLFAIAIAVGLTPELLPMILSVTMGKGSIEMAKRGVIVKKLSSIPSFGSMDILCTDKTGTLTKDHIELIQYNDVHGNKSEEVLLYAYLNSIHQTGIVNPMDNAVRNYKKLNIKGFKKIDEIPFDFMRKRMSVIMEKQNKRTLICKGAPEEIFKVCKNVLHSGKNLKFDEKRKNEAIKLYEELSKDGYRVLAIAIKDIKSQHRIYPVSEEINLTLIGFISFLDPPKESAKKVIRELDKSGIQIKIITGDNEFVTKKICEKLGIKVEGVLLSSQIDGLTDDALKIAAHNNTIFARFSPDEKNRIIRALQSGGHTVGYMGDGINDAPSLKTADIGISVNNAVDVAKESADMVLTQKDLRVLYHGVLEGRKTFGNSMKYIMMGISSNFGNMFSVIGAVLYLPYLPMLPLQILLNNLLYDISQITIPTDKVDQEYIEKPRKWDMPFVQKFMIVFGLISSAFDFLTFFVLYQVFSLQEGAFQTGWFIESLATQTLIIHFIRTKKIPFIQSRASKGLTMSTILIVLIGWLIPFSPIAHIFGFVPLSKQILFVIAGIVLLYLITIEFAKRIFYLKVKEA